MRAGGHRKLFDPRSHDQPGCACAPKCTKLRMRICRCPSDRADSAASRGCKVDLKSKILLADVSSRCENLKE